MQRDDAAVSPVLGTILLVAITVLLAATVFVMVGIFADQRTEPAPAIAFQDDELGNEIRVLAADDDVDWSDLGFSGSCEPLLNGAPMPTDAGIQVEAGDVLSCDAGEDLQIVAGPDRGNALLYRTSFA